jgi:hypothetical protein
MPAFSARIAAQNVNPTKTETNTVIPAKKYRKIILNNYVDPRFKLFLNT